MKKVLAAMSGGVDSSAALILLKKEYEVIGATLKLHDGELDRDGYKTCCSLSDIEDARQTAARLDVTHYVFNMKELFKETVIDRFISCYENGMTPNPCIDCNIYVKFGALLERALSLGCDYIATGHYARIEYDESLQRWLLKRSVSETDGSVNPKDQTYVLYGLTQYQLAHTLFPLGNMDKAAVRTLAEQNGLVNARKADSQDICFVPDGKYADFIRQTTGKDYPGGDVTDSGGKVVGRHMGLINYTIGQRKGLGIAFGVPAYVIGKDMKNNRLLVGSPDELLSRSFTADNMNWIMFEKPEKPFRCKAKTRYRMAEKDCAVYPRPDGSVYVEFDEPQRAITPGQRVVFYDGDIVVGGGEINFYGQREKYNEA